jgi:hypothetical protein
MMQMFLVQLNHGDVIILSRSRSVTSHLPVLRVAGTSGASSSSSSSSSSAQAAVAASLALDVGSGNALSESTDLGSSSSDAVLEKKKKRRNKNNNSGGGGVSSSGSSGSTSSGVDAASTLGALRGSQLATVCSSGFNPPPPHRKLAGDLIYLEVKCHYELRKAQLCLL